MTHSGHFLFQTNRADGFASRDQNPAVQNVRSNQDKSVQNDHQSSEKSFDKTLEDVSHSETPKADETYQATDASEVSNEKETNVFEVAKELKKEIQASGLSEEETDILSQSGFINVVFALAEGRNAASIGTDLLEQTKQLISPELLNRIHSIVASPVESPFVSAGLQQVDEIGVLNQAASAASQSSEDVDPVLQGILNKSSLSNAGQFFAENPNVSADDIVTGNPIQTSAASQSQNVATYLANDVVVQSATPESQTDIVTNNSATVVNTITNQAQTNTAVAQPQNTAASAQTQNTATQATTSDADGIQINVPTDDTADADLQNNTNASQQSVNQLGKQTSSTQDQTQTLFKEHIHQQKQSNDESVLAQKADQNSVLNIISEKSEIVTTKATSEAPSLAFKESASVPDQIKVSIARAMNGKQNHISIQLDPAELGKVDIKMEWQANGKTTVAVIVEKAETYELLQRDAKELAKALGNAGLNVESGNLEFNLQQQQQQHYGQSDQDKHQSGHNAYAHLNEASGENDEYYVESLVARLYDYNMSNYDSGVDISI